MIDKDKKNNISNLIVTTFRKNFRLIIFLLVIVLLLFIFFQFYLYQKERSVYKQSILFDQLKSNFDSSDFEEKMKLIAEENNFFGLLSSLEIIKKQVHNKEYDLAYNQYLTLLKNNKSKKIYNNIISLQASYKLIDHISSEKISIILSFFDDSFESLLGFKYEIEFLLSINNNNISKKDEILKKILNNENISESIKERVKKINEFQKYK